MLTARKIACFNEASVSTGSSRYVELPVGPALASVCPSHQTEGVWEVHNEFRNSYSLFKPTKMDVIYEICNTRGCNENAYKGFGRIT